MDTSLADIELLKSAIKHDVLMACKNTHCQSTRVPSVDVMISEDIGCSLHIYNHVLLAHGECLTIPKPFKHKLRDTIKTAL